MIKSPATGNLILRYKRHYSINRIPGAPTELPAGWKWPEWYTTSRELNRGNCLWCGKHLDNSRLQYCSESPGIGASCKRRVMWTGWVSYNLRVTSLRRFLHKWYNFECCRCGIHASKTTPAGVELPIIAFEGDHHQALVLGGEDHWDNMRLLCPACHKLKTAEDMAAYERTKVWKPR